MKDLEWLFKVQPEAFMVSNICGLVCLFMEKSNAKFQLAVCGDYSGKEWKSSIYKYQVLSPLNYTC